MTDILQNHENDRTDITPEEARQRVTDGHCSYVQGLLLGDGIPGELSRMFAEGSLSSVDQFSHWQPNPMGVLITVDDQGRRIDDPYEQSFSFQANAITPTEATHLIGADFNRLAADAI